MKVSALITTLFLIMIGVKSQAQISFKAESFGSSSFRDKDNHKVGDSKGSATVYSGDIKIPVSMKTTKDSLPVMWGVDLSGAYASLKNQNFTQDLAVSNITNLQFSVFNMRQLNKKWSLIAFAGAGIYTAGKPFEGITGNTILGNGGAIFIKKINSKLDLGGGLVFNNSLGYPMLFPAIYVNYNSEGKYTFRFSMLNGLEASAGYNLNKTVTLNLIAEANGQVALLKKDGKNMMFTHQYLVAGLRPEIKINKHLTLPLTAGVNAVRFAYFNDRSLKSIFSDKNDHSFSLSPYFAAEIRYNF